MPELNASNIEDLLEKLQSRDLTALELVEACIERIEAREDMVGAWTYFSAAMAREQAKQLDGGPLRGILHGIPIGVKDIIDTKDMPTECGTAIYQGRRPADDADSVGIIREAGAVVMGKTVATEFAYFRPGKTSNPHKIGYTPGGSSSGSAAAVGDCMVPLAFGTQTAASVTRPAAYCGVVGYKATKDLFSLSGVQGLAKSLDTLGWFSRSTADAEIMRAAFTGEKYQPLEAPAGSLRVGLCHTYEWPMAEAGAVKAMELTAQRLSAGSGKISELTLPPQFAEVTEHQKIIMAYDAARMLKDVYAAHAANISPQLTELITAGTAIGDADYQHAQTSVAEARAALSTVFDQYDVIIAPSAAGEAPEGLGATGDPIFSRMWNILHNPSVALPVAKGENGMPIGVQLIGPLGADRQLLAHAKWAEDLLGFGSD